MAHLKRTSNDGIFPKVPINEATCIAVYSDSWWANAEGFTPQHGALVLLTNQNVTQVPSPGIFIDWKSGRSGRVCRSTLAAEASAADMSIGRATFINFMISEIIQNCRSFEIQRALHMIHIIVRVCTIVFAVLIPTLLRSAIAVRSLATICES